MFENRTGYRSPVNRTDPLPSPTSQDVDQGASFPPDLGVPGAPGVPGILDIDAETSRFELLKQVSLLTTTLVNCQTLLLRVVNSVEKAGFTLSDPMQREAALQMRILTGIKRKQYGVSIAVLHRDLTELYGNRSVIEQHGGVPGAQLMADIRDQEEAITYLESLTDAMLIGLVPTPPPPACCVSTDAVSGLAG